MKNTFTMKSRRVMGFVMMMSMMFASFMLSSCGNDSYEEPSYQNEVALPESADNFIHSYYPTTKLVKVTVSEDSSGLVYSAYLANAHIVRFDVNGDWKDVVAPGGRPIPSGITPVIIAEYISKTNIGQGVSEIRRDYKGYDVKLTNGIEMNFDADYAFLQ